LCYPFGFGNQALAESCFFSLPANDMRAGSGRGQRSQESVRRRSAAEYERERGDRQDALGPQKFHDADSTIGDVP